MKIPCLFFPIDIEADLEFFLLRYGDVPLGRRNDSRLTGTGKSESFGQIYLDYEDIAVNNHLDVLQLLCRPLSVQMEHLRLSTLWFLERYAVSFGALPKHPTPIQQWL